MLDGVDDGAPVSMHALLRAMTGALEYNSGETSQIKRKKWRAATRIYEMFSSYDTQIGSSSEV